ncbi:MAG: amidophosphoribosyltransferase [Flavobacteriales bacterium]|nr:amidophosphoribosyltransferase [Flavobacteriales bacterium]
MSDFIKHECGIAMIRLRKPLQYYREKYGTSFYGLNKLYLLMEKQHNRGQDGVGVANVKLDTAPGTRYISRIRSISSNPIKDVFEKINRPFGDIDKDFLKDPQWLKTNLPFSGEVFLGHLRYGTYGKNSIESCHPFLRQNNWKTRNLVLAGNFNLTNVDELFQILIDIGQHPKEKSDTITVMEKIGHFLDMENQSLFDQFKSQGNSRKEISDLIANNLDVGEILRNSALDWDGGYVMAGLMGHGDSFVLRDPSGIRPAFYYADEEIVAITSERPALQTAFQLGLEDVQEVPPGNALIIKKSGEFTLEEIRKPLETRQCSFERIYFSRGSDADIYKERKKLGKLVCPAIFRAIEFDIKNTVFSFIPNTAEVAFYGMVQGVEDYLNEVKTNKIKSKMLDDEELAEMISRRPRVEKIAIKDAKLRTFITEDTERDDLVEHVYDITYGTVRNNIDNLVVIDDSIVRGTTLKKSILRMLGRLSPKSIIIVSSAPQIRYPDCYGIDMAKLGDFVAFRAAIALLKERGKESIIDDVYQKCLSQIELPKDEVVNYVKEIYEPFNPEEISNKIAQLLTPEDLNCEVQIIYQGIEGLHEACPKHIGDWYFTGDYPTPGGNKVVNKAFINYVQGNNERAY